MTTEEEREEIVKSVRIVEEKMRRVTGMLIDEGIGLNWAQLSFYYGGLLGVLNRCVDEVLKEDPSFVNAVEYAKTFQRKNLELTVIKPQILPKEEQS